MRYSLLIILVLISGSFGAKASDWSAVRNQKFVTRKPRKILPADPVYGEIFQKVDKAQLVQTLQRISGSLPVTVNGNTFSITERYSPDGKNKFRQYWRQFFTDLGITNQEFSYPTQHSVGETDGHNLEAILPGKSADSVVIIVHYDSIGPAGQETSNPGVDDDTSGMAMMMETARILAQYQSRLQYTVRFVAADYEEHAFPGLEGARNYAKYIQALSQKNGFKIVGGIDNEQSGWNCLKEGGCSDAQTKPSFDIFSCEGDGSTYNFPQLNDLLTDTTAHFSQLLVSQGCMGANSDHYALWEIGVPAIVFSEHQPFDNPHFDQTGGDTFDKIDQDYFFKIAQVGVTFAARVINVEAN